MTDAVSQRIKELFDSGYYCAEDLTARIARDRPDISESLLLTV
jgi:hypothetical protein